MNKKDETMIREIDTFSGITANSQAYLTQKGANVDGFTQLVEPRRPNMTSPTKPIHVKHDSKPASEFLRLSPMYCTHRSLQLVDC
jgi:hypothetical protein